MRRAGPDRAGPTARNYAGAPLSDAVFCLIIGDEIVNTLFITDYLKKKRKLKGKAEINPVKIPPLAARTKANFGRALSQSTVQCERVYSAKSHAYYMFCNISTINP